MQDHEALSGTFDPDAEIAAAAASAPEPEAELAPEPEPEGTGEGLDVQGTMRWAEFNRRNRELEQERLAIQAERRDNQAKQAGYRDFEEFTRVVQANPQLADAIKTAFDEHAPRMREPQSAIPLEVQKEMRSLRTEMEEQRIELLANRIEAEAERLKRENSISAKDAKAVVKQAFDEGILDVTTPRDQIGRRLTMVYRSMNFDKAKGAGERELAGKLREGQRAASPGGKPRGTDVEPEPEYDSKMSYEQIAAAEIKRLGLTKR